MHPSAAVGLLFLVGSAPARSGEPAAPAAVGVLQAAGAATEIANGVEAELTLRSGERRTVDARTWTPDAAFTAGFLMLDVRAGAAPKSAVLSRDRLEAQLLGGERLVGAVQRGRGDVLALTLGPGISASFEIDALAGLSFPARLAAGEAALLEAPPSGDRLYRASGGRVERVDGTFEAFRDEGIAFASVLGKNVFPWSDVVALYVENAGDEDGTDGPETTAPRAVCVDLVDGSRLFAAWLGSTHDGLEFERGGERATVGWPWVDELSLRSADFVQLSGLEPSRIEAPSPFGDELGFTYQPRFDRAVDGAPLTAGGRVWRRGIGVHAPTRLVWQLDGAWKSLRGAAAVDDQVLRLPSRGSVEFRILTDGRLAWRSNVLRGGDAPLEWPAVSLEGVRELVLEVDPTADLHVADRADWLSPYLVR
ncbi:MAG: NPCBM/NEW2 domain-containing protein [Planctomycetes bacterium]|nr:NPCBM/NEW2 domain-containing protein [Planctomycetota bacterium]